MDNGDEPASPLRAALLLRSGDFLRDSVLADWKSFDNITPL